MQKYKFGKILEINSGTAFVLGEPAGLRNEERIQRLKLGEANMQSIRELQAGSGPTILDRDINRPGRERHTGDNLLYRIKYVEEGI